MNRTVGRLVVSLALLGAGAGCGDGAEGERVLLPGPAEGEILAVEPGGETLCAKGDPYQFVARGGDPNRVIIDFQGGGACWNTGTCAAGESVYFQDATTADELEGMVQGSLFGGYYELDNGDNPFAGWSLVHLPYCTGDIHWGDATVDYADDLTIHHRGFENARAAIAWVYEHYEPEEILMSGFSAGSYGAIGHAPHVAELYPEARITVLGDSGSGIITDDFFAQSFPNWNVERVLPRHIPALANRDPQNMTIVELWTSVANHYRGRDMRFAQYSSAFDKDQTLYFTFMGGDPDAWSGKLRNSFEAIRSGADNFRYYLAEGPIHGGTVFDVFYMRETSGTPFADWLGNVAGAHGVASGAAEMPDDVACRAEACLSDAICDACAADEIDDVGTCVWCLNW